jgi:hypothetical protein
VRCQTRCASPRRRRTARHSCTVVCATAACACALASSLCFVGVVPSSWWSSTRLDSTRAGCEVRWAVERMRRDADVRCGQQRRAAGGQASGAGGATTRHTLQLMWCGAASASEAAAAMCDAIDLASLVAFRESHALTFASARLSRRSHQPCRPSPGVRAREHTHRLHWPP